MGKSCTVPITTDPTRPTGVDTGELQRKHAGQEHGYTSRFVPLSINSIWWYIVHILIV